MSESKRTALAVLVCGVVAAGMAGCGGGGGAASASGTTSADVATTGSSTTSSTAGGAAPTSLLVAPKIGDCELFSADAVFNTRIDDTARFPVHGSSNAWISMAGGGTAFRADWWLSEDPTQRDAYYGMPVNLVDGTPATTDWTNLLYDFGASGVSSAVGWPHESDCAVDIGSGFSITQGCSAVPVSSRRFPIPTSNVKNEGGTCSDPNSCGDHHMLVVEQGACRLWEGFSTYKLSGQWYALSTAAWNLKSMSLRPEGWTSADAAGLPITPFLVKADEAASGEIRHALRVTMRDAVLARSHVWPARHDSGGDTPGGIPFGAVMRLRADFVIPDSWTPQAKAIATAAKRYGLYVADIGEDFYVQGEPSARWDESTFKQLGAGITLSNMEFVDMGAVTGDARFSADSMAARWH